ncbi:hypothetical protein [Streptomyces sp. NPDC005780]|uniref:hypothetical protein n=1 Tax=Streptomyces sp. NPDC005780 TaxID=3364730 RepID=UPI003679503B
MARTGTVGVEEELLLVDARSGEPQAPSTAVLALAERRAAGDSVFGRRLKAGPVGIRTPR